EPGQAANKAGLQVGDIIVRYNGRAVGTSNGMRQLRQAILRTAPGLRVGVEIVRKGERQALTGTMARRPARLVGWRGARRGVDKCRLEGRRALVTGGSRGLGRAMARALAEAGADLVLVGRDHGSLGLVREELAPLARRVDVLTADLGEPAAAEKLCDRVL